MALNSQLLTVQILTNDVQVLILCLSYFITTVSSTKVHNLMHMTRNCFSLFFCKSLWLSRNSKKWQYYKKKFCFDITAYVIMAGLNNGPQNYWCKKMAHNQFLFWCISTIRFLIQSFESFLRKRNSKSTEKLLKPNFIKQVFFMNWFRSLGAS